MDVCITCIHSSFKYLLCSRYTVHISEHIQCSYTNLEPSTYLSISTISTHRQKSTAVPLLSTYYSNVYRKQSSIEKLFDTQPSRTVTQLYIISSYMNRNWTLNAAAANSKHHPILSQER
jgi:hypothetical protein